MMHFLKINAKPIIKAIAQITNVAAIAVGSLQATGVLAMLEPRLNVMITMGIIAINMLAHYLKPYVEATDAATGATVAVAAALTPAPVVVPPVVNANSGS